MEIRRKFLNDVISNIRSKEAKDIISQELNHHISETKRELIQQNVSPDSTEEKAIQQMGNPFSHPLTTSKNFTYEDVPANYEMFQEVIQTSMELIGTDLIIIVNLGGRSTRYNILSALENASYWYV